MQEPEHTPGLLEVWLVPCLIVNAIFASINILMVILLNVAIM
jgi:hypothetical protein